MISVLLPRLLRCYVLFVLRWSLGSLFRLLVSNTVSCASRSTRVFLLRLALLVQSNKLYAHHRKPLVHLMCSEKSFFILVPFENKKFFIFTHTHTHRHSHTHTQTFTYTPIGHQSSVMLVWTCAIDKQNHNYARASLSCAKYARANQQQSF